MKKLITLFLLISLLFGYAFLLTSCKDNEQTPSPDDDTTLTPPAPDTEDGPTIVVPEYKDYGRGTVNFKDLTYSSPNVAAIIAGFDDVTKQIRENKITPQQMIELIVDMEDDYVNYVTMYTLAEINNSIDCSNEFWLKEYTYLSTGYSDFSQAIEDMYVAAAQSEHKAVFENEYFGFSLDEYVDGGIYTDRLVELMAREAELIAQYNGFSTSTVKITLPDGTVGTVDELLEGVSQKDYLSLSALYKQYYDIEVTRLTKELYIELVKVRIQIADEMGKESYTEVGYGNLGHDYSKEKTLSFLADIKETMNIISELYYNYFAPTLYYEIAPSANHVDVINDLYSLFCDMDEEIGEIYAYMLQHGLYDVAPAEDNRLNAAYTTYIEGNSSPFIFMSASSKCKDYVTLAHEFGHFTDAYVNGGMGASLDLSEVYSQALSYLMLLNIKDDMSATAAGQKAYKYMLMYEMSSIADILIYQGYLATFEHLVYELEYDEVTEDKLCELMDEAQTYALGATSEGFSTWEAVLIVHTVEYPFYVQSYCTSLVAAVEIMLLEIDEKGAGLNSFKTLLEREGNESLTFEEQLERAGISSPLEDDALVDMFKGLYRFITGRSYGNTSNKLPDAA